jgi:hypothetical protein
MPCLAYNVHAELVPACRTELVRLQTALATLGPGLLQCPPDAIHVSLAFLLAVRKDHDLDKELLWAHHGAAWTAAVREIVAGLMTFAISFTHLSVTDTAVIALAEPIAEIGAIRAGVARLRTDAGLEGGQPTIVHATLLRYGTEPFDRDRLVELAEGQKPSTTTSVSRIVICKELVYPCLVTEEVAGFDLPS